MSNVDPLNPNANYDVPKGDSKYLKFEKGSTKFLAVGSAIVGWEYWNNAGKPVRLSEKPEVAYSELPDIRAERDGNYKVNHFWVFPVVDCSDGKVKILEITQKSVQKQIRAYIENEDWGSPVQSYTITVNRTGDGMLDTEYNVMANPTKVIDPQWIAEWDRVKKAGFDLNELYKGGDPFKPTHGVSQAEVDAQFEGQDAPEHEEEVIN